MISGVSKQIDGESRAFRLTTRAMRAIEQENGKSIVQVLAEMGGGDGVNFSITRLASLLAQAGNDGAGSSENEADAVIDALGVEGAAKLMEQVIEAAFPEAKKAAPGKNAARAARPA